MDPPKVFIYNDNALLSLSKVTTLYTLPTAIAKPAGQSLAAYTVEGVPLLISIRIDQDQSGSIRIDQDRSGSIRIDQDRSGSIRIDQDRSGLFGILWF
jgi:hypothetical protein